MWSGFRSKCLNSSNDISKSLTEMGPLVNAKKAREEGTREWFLDKEIDILY